MNLKDEYRSLFTYESLKKELINLTGVTSTECCDKLIIDQKRKIRKVVNKIPDRRYIRSDLDSYIELIYLPKEITSEEIAEEYFDAYERREIHSAYDCTGKLFTVWHKVCKFGNRWYCYHCIAIDC